MGSVSRRRFLQLGAAAAATAAVSSACGSDKPPRDTDRDGIPDALETTTTQMSDQKRRRLTDVQHVVIIQQAGASFDQVFGTRKGVGGFDDPDATTLPTGKPIWYQPNPRNPDGYTLPFPMAAAGPAAPCFPGIESSWTAQHAAWGNGRMDGCAQQMGDLAMGYFGRQDLPWHHALADEFTLCSRWFSSVLGPANPNRAAAISGSIDPGGRSGGPVTDNLATGFGWETYPERLLRAGVSWRMYQAPDATDANVLRRFVQFQEARPTDPLHQDAMVERGIDEFEQDCADGSLPYVSWVVLPDPAHPNGGVGVLAQEALTARYVRAVTTNPAIWASTAIILMSDTSGGFFDHVVPPTPFTTAVDTPADFVGDEPIGLGPRVPALVVSPWSRGGVRNETVVDHTSVLRLLEQRFGVEAPAISRWRRENTGDLLDAFDFDTFDDTAPHLPTPVPQPARTAKQCRDALALWPGPPAPQVPPEVAP